MARATRIGILGMGNVGSGLVELLRRNARLIETKSNVSLEIRRVLVRNPDKPRPVDRSLLTTRIEDVIQDPEIGLVVELIGGIEPARTFILQALEAGKNVVTANKAVLAAHGDELFGMAAKKGRTIGFEASVCGGIPIIRALTAGLVANRIEQLCGILNGTCNYVLTRMTQDGLSYAEALRKAQEGGLAEADPTLDVKGVDAAHKLVILAELCYQAKVGLDDMIVEGIETIEAEDIRTAREFGFVIKLVAVGQRQGEKLDLRVHPALISTNHPLSGVHNEYNAVMIRGDAIGEMIFYGKGAGSFPTASAVLSDVIDIARNPSLNGFWASRPRAEPAALEAESRFYLRFPIYDLPGVIGLITTALGNHQISITHAQATLVTDRTGRGSVKIITHKTREGKLRQALVEISRLPVLTQRPIALRILE